MSKVLTIYSFFWITLVLSGETTLLEDNPFIWSGFNASDQSITQNTAPTNNAEYSFDGVYSVASKYYVLLTERTGAKLKRWYPVPTKEERISVLEFNPESLAVLVDTGVKQNWVQLKTLDSNSSPIPVAGANTGVVGANPSDREQITDQRNNTRRRVVRPSRTDSSRRTSLASSRRRSSVNENFTTKDPNVPAPTLSGAAPAVEPTSRPTGKPSAPPDLSTLPSVKPTR